MKRQMTMKDYNLVGKARRALIYDNAAEYAEIMGTMTPEKAIEIFIRYGFELPDKWKEREVINNH